MEKYVLLDIDYYRNLLAEGPGVFLDIVERDDFVNYIIHEIKYLIVEIRKRTRSADDEERDLLTAKLLIAMGTPQFMTNEMKNVFANSEDTTAEEQLSGRSNQLDPIHSGEIRQPFRIPNLSDLVAKNKFHKLSTLCFMMKLHGRLVTLIEETPVFNVGWNLVNLNRLPLLAHHAPILGLYESPADYNNSNYPYL